MRKTNQKKQNMKYRKAGKTGKYLSVISMGGMRFPENQDVVNELVESCVENGINYYELSPGYVNGMSEKLVGSAIRPYRDDIHLSTKCNYKTNPTEDSVYRKVEESLTALQTDYIDFYHSWFVNDINDMPDMLKGHLKAMQKLKEQGVISHIGMTTHMDDGDIVKALEMFPFECVTISYNLLNAHLRPKTIDYAYKNGIAVFAMNPVGGGILATENTMFDDLHKNKPFSLVGAALLFVLSHKEITTAVNGLDNAEMAKHSIEQVKYLGDFDSEDAKEIYNAFKALGPTFCVGCDYCLPCPENVMIPRYLKMLNQYILGGIDNVLPAYKRHLQAGRIKPDNIPENCVECGVCLPKCTAHLDIPEKLKQAQEMLMILDKNL